MKKTLAITLALMVLVINLALPASAWGSCNGNHDPWTLSCSHDTTVENRSHTFDYHGYTKTCYYKYVLAYTNRTCQYCHEVEEHVWQHSHGYRDHVAECGWINGTDNTCYLR